mmetsp:Transcript_100741/g.260742  ORF Transcript_100741/g.260742 Transcript_100741/m.260742 type:complete len:267 (+) Transcript_100741:61-861(+)
MAALSSCMPSIVHIPARHPPPWGVERGPHKSRQEEHHAAVARRLPRSVRPTQDMARRAELFLLSGSSFSTMPTASERPFTSWRGPLISSSATCLTVASTLSNASSMGAASTPGMAAAILTAASSVRSPKALFKCVAKSSAFSRPVRNVFCTSVRAWLSRSSVTLRMPSMISETFMSDSATELASSSTMLKLVLSFSAIASWPTDVNTAVATPDVVTTAAEMLSQSGRNRSTAPLIWSSSTSRRAYASAFVLFIFVKTLSLTDSQTS